jgi:peroxiredoxin
LKHFAEEQKLTYPLLSDFMRKVSDAYGVLLPDRGIAMRTTFVIDKDGRVQYIEQGGSAINPDGAVTACKRVKSKS